MTEKFINIKTDVCVRTSVCACVRARVRAPCKFIYLFFYFFFTFWLRCAFVYWVSLRQ